MQNQKKNQSSVCSESTSVAAATVSGFFVANFFNWATLFASEFSKLDAE